MIAERMGDRGEPWGVPWEGANGSEMWLLKDNLAE
jgi:hypothetical protein